MNRTSGRAWLVVGLIAVCVVAVSIVDPPPTEEQITGAFEAVGWWAFAAAGVMAFLEVGTPIGLVAPAEFAVPLAGASAAAGSVSLWVAIGAIWAFAAAGESLSFLIGRRLGRGFIVRHAKRLHLTPERLGKFDRHFARHGELTVIAARFGPYVRTLTPFLAGGSRMPYRRFLAASLIGTCLWTVALCLAGYFLFERLALARDLALGVGLALLLVAVVVAFRAAAGRRGAAARGRVGPVADEG